MHTNEKIAFLLFFIIIAVPYLIEALILLSFLICRLRAKKSAKILTSKLAIATHIIAATGILCFLYGLFIEPTWIQVNTFEIETEKLTATSIRLVHISDMHCDKKTRNEKRLVRIINDLQPDVIAYTGDSLNTPSAMPLFKETMAALKAKIAKVAVLGNFDEWAYQSDNLFDGTGFLRLDSTTLTLQKQGEDFCLSGLRLKKLPEYKNLFTKIPPDYYSIFLCHFSDLVEDTRDFNIDLYLAGHTHGGQVRLPFYGAVITLAKFGKKYEGGMYNAGNTTLYVNRGIGMEPPPAPPVRFLARPEITVFDIVPKKQ